MKLPKPIKRGSTYRITVTYQKKRYSATRDTAKECEQWAALKLLELKTVKAQEEKGIKPPLPFDELCKKYYFDKGIKLRSKTTIRSKIDSIHRILNELATKSIYEFSPNDIVKWRNKRLLEVKSSTVSHEFAIFSSIFTYAQKELFLIDSNVWTQVIKPAKGKPRSQRIMLEDEQLILEYSSWRKDNTPTKVMHYVAWSFLFALETAMRQGEILAMRRTDIKDGFIHLRMTKNSESRDVPLSKEARRLIDLLPSESHRLVPVKQDSFRSIWAHICKKANLDHLNFHDTRHEAITRMVKNKRLPVEVLAKITGHKTIGILINTYYNPDAQDLVEMFNRSES